MKKCKGCNQEIDKYAISCEYCGKLAEDREKTGQEEKQEGNGGKKKPGKQP